MKARSDGTLVHLPGFVIGIAISGACLWFAFSRVNWPDLRVALDHVGHLWLGGALGVHLARILTLVWRWRVLLSSQGERRWKIALGSLAVGYAANTILPFRSGDLARIGGVSRLTGIPAGRVSAALLMERLGDALALVLLAAISLFFLPEGFWRLWRGPSPADSQLRITAALMAVILGCMVMVWKWILPRFSPRLAGRLTRFLAELRAGFVTSLAGRRQPAWIGLSLLTWLLEVVTYLFVLRAIGLPLMFWDSLVLCALGSLVVLIPGAPGGFGTFELAIQTLLGLYGYDPSQGLVASLLIHTMVLLPITLIGSVYMLKYTHAFRAVARRGTGLERNGPA